MTSEMEKALKDIPMEILTLDNLGWEKNMVKGYIHGRMERYMMESGIKG